MNIDNIIDRLDSRYTPYEVVEALEIPMEVLIERLWEYLAEEKYEEMMELIIEGEEEENVL